MSPKSLSVVILSHNRPDELRANLPRLLSHRAVVPTEFILVDNGSDDATVCVVKDMALSFPDLTVVLGRDNPGPPGGMNKGIARATGDYIALLDDDAFVEPETLSTVPRVFGELPDAGILAFAVRHAKTNILQNDAGESRAAIANYHGAAHAFRRDVFEAIGLHDEACTFGAEELDMSIRAHAHGFETIFVPDVSALHNSLQRQGCEGQGRMLSWAMGFARVLHKHFPRRMARLFSQRILAGLVLTGSARYGVSFVPRLWRSYLQGVSAGVCNHVLVPWRTIEFYSDPSLRPEFGNIPLLRKVAHRLARWRRSPSQQ